MLFNSYAFIFGYLPVTLAGYLLLVRRFPLACVVWLATASVVFYAGWNPRYVPLLLISVVGNYGFSRLIRRPPQGSGGLALAAAITLNLLLLAYYKYMNFFADVVRDTTGLSFTFGNIILPLGISFFTFTQIAFLVDLYRGKASDLSFPKYLLFVTFFPHLVAGPILHHASIVPQFTWPEDRRASDLAVGSAIFVIGLCKKVIFADSLANFVTPVFAAAVQGQPIGLVESWSAVLAYSLQLYFDFSGYSDMAIGLARMCGVHFPLNFASPYKAANIIEFWRRWHMTLSQFLRDYLYIPLGGNRRGSIRRYLNLMVTMVLGGLWHGPSWNFVLWGALHGAYLVVNHGWSALTQRFGWRAGAVGRPVGVLMTFVAVTFAWVLFRAASLPAAWDILNGMIGLNGVRLPLQWQARIDQLGLHASWVSFADMGATFTGGRQVALTCALLAVVFFLPNTQQIMAQVQPALDATPDVRTAWWQWQPTPAWAFALAILTLLPLLLLNQASEFLYYQF